MAKKKKGPRQHYGMKCTVCGNFNYLAQRNKINTEEKLKLSKYCKTCKTHTEHKETSKLK